MLFTERFLKRYKGGNTGALFLAGLFFGITVIALFYPTVVFAGGHEDTGDLDYKVDLENKSGINLIIANLYNDHRLLFALAVTVTMAVVGIIIGQVTSVLLRLLGLK
jgi:ABC-type phosphate/phosphonate transport system permease subunit